MTKTILNSAVLITALVAATAVQASDVKQQRFERDGETYVYTNTQHGDRQVIDGRRLPAGSAFHLVVRQGRVSGTSGGVPVAFTIPAPAAIETAAR